jgi:hypothetical protein
MLEIRFIDEAIQDLIGTLYFCGFFLNAGTLCDGCFHFILQTDIKVITLMM